MVKRDREFEILLKDFLRTEGKNFSSKEEAIEVFERLYDLVEEGYGIDTPLGDIVDTIDEEDMSAVDKLSALRELHEENKDALERAIRLGEDILYSDNDEDTEQMILADVLAGYYREAGMYNEAAKLYKFISGITPKSATSIPLSTSSGSLILSSRSSNTTAPISDRTNPTAVANNANKGIFGKLGAFGTLASSKVSTPSDFVISLIFSIATSFTESANSLATCGSLSLAVIVTIFLSF